MQALVRVVDQQANASQGGNHLIGNQRAAMTHHALPRKAKIMMKCTVQNRSKNGPKTTIEIEKVP
jgi:hypothetical protein